MVGATTTRRQSRRPNRGNEPHGGSSKMWKWILKIMEAVARLGRRAEAVLVEEILHYHGFTPAYKRYWPDKGHSLAHDRVTRMVSWVFHKGMWKRPRPVGREEGFDFVHLGVDEVHVWTVLDKPEPEGGPKLDRVPLSDLDAALTRLGSSRSFFERLLD